MKVTFIFNTENTTIDNYCLLLGIYTLKLQN